MNPIDKIDRTYRQGLVLHGFCLTVYVILVYINFNLPFLAQTFAHHTFIPVELEESENALMCKYDISGWIYEPTWINDQNIAGIPEAFNLPKLTYKVGKKEYELKYTTYTGERLCKLEKTIYVSPLNPAWAVSDNRLPGDEVKQKLFEQSLKILLFTGLFIAFSCLTLSCRPKQLLAELKDVCSRKSIANAFVLYYATNSLIWILDDIYAYSFNESFIHYGLTAFLIGLIFYLLYMPVKYIIPVTVIYIFFCYAADTLWYYAKTYNLYNTSYYGTPFEEDIIFFMVHLAIILMITLYTRTKSKKELKPTP